MSEKKIRITKANRFADIKALLNGEPVKFGTDVATAMEVLDHEIELLSRKSNSDTKKMTAKMEEDEGFRNEILMHLATLPEDSDGLTCAMIAKAIPSLNEFTTQKISGLVKPLEVAGRVMRNSKKGKTFFKLA